MHRHDRRDEDEHSCAETILIAEKFEHSEYNSRTFENDITLLRLSQVHSLWQIDAVSPLTTSALALPPDSPSSRSR